MKRTRLTRKVALKRKARLNPRNQKRVRESFARAYGSADRVEWMRRQPCLVCGATPSENAHTANGGMGRKADADQIVPLCRSHHREQHEGQQTFELKYGLDLAAEAAKVEARWRNR